MSFFFRNMQNFLPIVRPFDQPFRKWTQRNATLAEAMASLQTGPISLTVNDELIACVTNEYDAAKFIANIGADNALEWHINSALGADLGFQQLLQNRPAKTPNALNSYQLDYPLKDYGKVDVEIRDFGALLSHGQLLFHGGQLPFPQSNTIVTSRPLSTTFCPQVALREAEYETKAYNAGEVCLYLLSVCSTNTQAFVFNPNSSKKGHEKEVLFASGVTLIQRSKELIRNDYTVRRYIGMNELKKQVNFYLCKVDLI